MEPTEDRGPRLGLPDIGILLSLAAAVVAYFPGVLSGRVMVPWDVLRVYPPWSQRVEHVNNLLLSDPVRLYAPWRTLLADALHHGRLPFWDPYVFAGTPFIANSQAAIFYPPNLLYGVLSIGAATTLLALFHFWICAAGVYFLGRLSPLRLSRAAAALGAIGCAFSGFAVVWAEFPTFMATYAWLPWSLLFLLLILERVTAVRVAGLAATVALGALAGHPQVWLYGLMGLATVALVDLAHRRGTPRQVLGRVGAAVVGIVAAVLLAAPQLLATLEAGPLIVRERENLNALVSSAFPGWLVPVAALPRAFGDSRLATWHGPANQNEMVAFCGVLSILLAVLSLARIRHRGVQALLAIEVLGWGIATGSPLLVVLYHVVPGLNQLRGVSRGTLLHSLALPLLAGVGLDVLRGWLVARRWRRALAWLAASAVALAGLYGWVEVLAAGRFDSAYLDAERGLLVPAAVALVVLLVAIAGAAARRPLRDGTWRVAAVTLPLLLFGETCLAYTGYNTADPGPPVLGEATRVTSLLQSLGGRFVAFENEEVTGNTAIAYHLSTLMGSDSFVLRDYADLYNAIEYREVSLFLNEAPPFRHAHSLESPLLDVMGVTAVVTRAAPTTLGTQPREVSLPPDRVLPRPHTGPILRRVDCLQRLDDMAVRRSIGSADVLTRGYTTDDFPAALNCPAASARPRVHDPANVGTFTPGRVSADGSVEGDTRAVPSATALVFAETYYPGWHVSVDGAPAPLLRVDHALMGVAVPAGTHHVRFWYVPRTLGAGLLLAGLALVGLAAACASGWVRVKDRPVEDHQGQP